MAAPLPAATGGAPSTSRRPEVAEIVRAYGDAYRARYRPTRAQRAVLRALVRCRTAALGGHLEACANCGATRPVYNSCRNRHCGKCQSLDQAKWREAQRAVLLPVPYFHVVFTLPHRLNAVIRLNQRTLYNLLFRTVAETLQQFAADPKHLGAELGISAVLHTWGQQLDYHVHLHCIVTGGGLTNDGQHWVASKQPDFLFPVRALAAKFRGKFLAHLTCLRDTGALRLIGPCAPLHDPRQWHRWIAHLRAKKWIVYAKPPFGGPEKALDYLGRYTHRIALSNERLVAIEPGTVSFRYKDYAHGNAIKLRTLPAVEFLRRFLLHVVPRGFIRVRHYGLLANRHRATKLARCRTLLGVVATPLVPPADESRADCVRRLTGIDITRCPVCGGGPMRFVQQLAPTPPDTS
jgi:hypothetical protein